MDRFTGARIDVVNHISQCVDNVMQTPLNSRPMALDYGSNIGDVVDLSMNPEGQAQIIAATAEAVTTWETRPAVERITIEPSGDGSAPVTLQWSYEGADASTTVET
jgi:phage baseplate assembly protein W